MKILNLVDLEKSEIKYQWQQFPDGQQNIKITSIVYDYSFEESDLKKTDVIQIKSRLNNWLDLEKITCAVASLRELEVEEIHLYVPYIMGARSDRKFEEGGNNYLRDVICPIINSLNFKTVTCIDPHSDVLEACIKGFRKESNVDLYRFAIREIYKPLTENSTNDGEEFILVSPDAGASKKIYKLAEEIGYIGNIITCSKDRDVNGVLTRTILPLSFNPKNNEDIIIIDDICDGGATFINIAKIIKNNHNWKNFKIYLIVTHSIFSKGTDELLKYFDGIYTTNSYKENNVEKVKILNVF